MADDDDNNNDLVDITAIVDSCAASLSYKNAILSNPSTFELHDAMSALELMDRKMDCCEVPISALRWYSLSSSSFVKPTDVHDDDDDNDNDNDNDDDRIVPPRPLPTGLDDSVMPLPWKDLSLADVSQIAMESLSRLEATLSGASVAESIYTCLYLHNAVLLDMKKKTNYIDIHHPKQKQQDDSGNDGGEKRVSTPPSAATTAAAAQQTLYAMALAQVAIAKIFRDTVIQADIYEEEDFSVQTYGLECLDGILSVESFLDIERGVVQCAAAATAKDGRIAELVLKFELDFLKACISMSKTNSHDVVSTAKDTIVTVKSGLEKLSQLKTLLDDPRIRECTDTPLLRRCFDPFMYRTLVGNAPVRKVAFRKTAESISILSTILSEIGDAACNVLLSGTRIGQIRCMVNRLSEKSLNILSRSLMVLNLYFDDKFLGQYDLKHLIEADMKQLSGAPDALFRGTHGNALLTRMAKPVYDTVKLFLLNRNRRQAYMDAAMIPDWASLQQEARAVDLNYCMERQLPTTTSPPFFSHYVLYNLVWLMDYYIALAVELCLFRGHHDLSVAYWYRDVLLSSLLNTLGAMKQTKLAARQKQQEPKSKGKKKGGKGSKKHNDTAPTREDLENDFNFTLFTLKRALSRGLARFIACLYQADMLQADDEELCEFTTHEIRFAKRFQPFACVGTPTPLTYDDYVVGSNYATVDQVDLLEATATTFRNAKDIVDTLLSMYYDKDKKQQQVVLDHNNISVTEEDLRGLAKVCVGNSVYVMKLMRDVTEGGDNNKPSGTVQFDFDANAEFCIIKIV